MRPHEDSDDENEPPAQIALFRAQVSGVAVWVESGSRSPLGHFVQECLSLLTGKKFEEP